MGGPIVHPAWHQHQQTLPASSSCRGRCNYVEGMNLNYRRSHTFPLRTTGEVIAPESLPTFFSSIFHWRQIVTAFVWPIFHSSLDGSARKYLLSHLGQYQVVLYNMLYCALFSQVLINLRNMTFLH